jgi:hypothetical protein
LGGGIFLSIAEAAAQVFGFVVRELVGVEPAS